MVDWICTKVTFYPLIIISVVYNGQRATLKNIKNKGAGICLF